MGNWKLLEIAFYTADFEDEGKDHEPINARNF